MIVVNREAHINVRGKLNLIMCKSITVVFAIIILTTDYSTAHSKANYTLVIETQLPNPATVRLGSHLYTVSKNVQYLNINSTSGKSCQLRLNPIDENIQGRLQVKSLNDDEKFLVWGIRKTQGSSRYYTLLIVDAIKCSYTPVTLPIEESIETSWPVVQPQIMVQEKSREFRVFYPQGSDCSPCRLNYNGKKLEKGSHSLVYYRRYKPASHFWIDSYLRSHSYDKYFYAFNFDNGTSTVHKMGIYYGSEERIHFNHTVDAASIKQGSYQNTAICYKSADKRRVTCERLDMKLEPGLSWDLPLSGNCNVSDISIDVNSVGHTFIGVLTTCRLHFFVYNVVGELAADLDFGRVDENYIHREVKGVWYGRNYCLEAVVYADSNVKDLRHVVKCVDVNRYILDTV